jgi:hypothetical protein
MYELKKSEVEQVMRILRNLDQCRGQTVKGQNALRNAKLLYKKITKRHDKDRRDQRGGQGHTRPA